jgi:hypothetical protein
MFCGCSLSFFFSFTDSLFNSINMSWCRADLFLFPWKDICCCYKQENHDNKIIKEWYYGSYKLHLFFIVSYWATKRSHIHTIQIDSLNGPHQFFNIILYFLTL